MTPPPPPKISAIISDMKMNIGTHIYLSIMNNMTTILIYSICCCFLFNYLFFI